MDLLLKKLVIERASASPELIKQTVSLIMSGKASPAQIGSFLTMLKLTGLESNPIIINIVSQEMREASLKVTYPQGSSADIKGTVDIVGTGGDGQNTFNVSTAAGIVCAGAGLLVAKV